jgi:hypothetical protein
VDSAAVDLAVDSAAGPEAVLVTDLEGSTMDLEKCTKLNALNVAMNVKFLSSQQKASLCTVMTVSKTTESFSFG